MSNEEAGDPSDRFRVDANAQTHFAWLRTRLAVERTMMAYLRTAVSLIGFGFTIFQFFYKLHQAPESGAGADLLRHHGGAAGCISIPEDTSLSVERRLRSHRGHVG